MNRYSLNNRSTVEVCEEIRQSIKVNFLIGCQGNLKRFCHQQNQLFASNQHKFYYTKLGYQEGCVEPPHKDDTLKFWNVLPVHFNKNASWLCHFLS